MRTDEVKDYLAQATDRVKKEDYHLLMLDVSERCIAARLAPAAGLSPRRPRSWQRGRRPPSTT